MLKYLVENSDGNLDYISYFNYLKDIKDKLPSNLYLYASDEKNYDLSSKTSLHDSWLEAFNVNEVGAGKRNELREIDINIKLLNAFHDRLIELKYGQVSNCNISDVNNDLGKGFGDIIAHEFSLNRSTCVHEIVFSSGANIIISFNYFESKVTKLQQQ